jgi:hypothetical protein
MPGLIDAATIAALHAHAEQEFAAAGPAPTYGPAVDRSFRVFPGVDRHGALAAQMMMAPAMGRNMARLLARDRLRVLIDSCLLKMPTQSSVHADTIFHQDFPGHPVDRSGFLTLWIALHDMTAEAGAMQFYDRSHTYGSQGWVFADGVDLRQRCAMLKDDDLSPRLAMKAGDATAHHSLTVHGAPPNLSAARRWAYTVIYMDADTRYNGAAGLFPDGVTLAPYAVMDHPVFPLVPVS